MSTYALLMAKAMRKYFRENFDGAEIANIQPSESFPVYGNLITVYINTTKSFQLLQDFMGFILQFTEMEYYTWNYQ